MSKPYCPILATLGYVLSPDGEKVLLIHRNARPDDLHYGKYNGLGGKLEPNEDVVEGMRREIREEAGIECTRLRLAGTINWPGFGKDGQDWFGFVFVISAFSGTALSHNAEGSLEWMPITQLESLPLWEGDRHFLPLIFAPDTRAIPSTFPNTFHGVMPYENGRPLSWTYTIL